MTTYLSSTPPRSALAVILAVLLIVSGLALGIGGFMLVQLDGSWYYLCTGVAFALSGILLLVRNTLSAWLYALMLLWTLIWSLMDGGLDFWILLGRLAFPFGIGVLFLIPSVKRHLIRGPGTRILGNRVAGAYAVALVIMTVTGLIKGDPVRIKPTQALPDVAAVMPDTQDWPVWGNDEGGTRFSPLSQITPDNVDKLEVAWTYRTGDYPPPVGKTRRLEVTPIKVGDSLYLCSARSDIIALDAETGKERWRFEAKPDLTGVTGSAACRGVAYYKLPDAQPDTLCAERIYGPTVDARMIAVDARTGQRCPGFADNGEIDLTQGMGEVLPGYYFASSAPHITRGNVVVGGWVSDGQSVGEPSGVVRAFDAVTGELTWAFDIGNPSNRGEPAEGEVYTRGTPNVWAPISSDEKLGLVFLPTGNATPDYYGAHRSAADEKYSSSVIAVDSMTGQERWVFQTAHHDLWDYDVASQPTLLDLDVDGKTVPALIQPTKRGQLFVLDRRTGEPIRKVEELPVPQGSAPGERLSPTQPFSTELPSFDGMPLDESDMWGMTPFDSLWCRVKFKEARWEGTMTPPGLQPFIVLPSSLGGTNWGSVSVDPERRYALVPWARVAMRNWLIPREKADDMGLVPDTGRGEDVGGAVAQAGVPYAVSVSPFLSPLGAPCTAPPYGLISLVDLNNNQIIWTQRLGTARDTGPMGLKSHLPIPMGTPLAGGGVITRSGLIFIGAASEQALRAIDASTGEILWKGRVPAGPQATPMTYISRESGSQFVVIAAGGHTMLQTTPGDYIVAFKLKD